MATNYIWNSVTDNVLLEVDDAGVQATYTQEPVSMVAWCRRRETALRATTISTGRGRLGS